MTEETKLRVGSYARVSHPSDTSIASQRATSEAWIKRESGWTRVFDRADDGISASTFTKKKRPEWQDVMVDISEGNIDLLIVAEISRASRDRLVFATLFAACGERGVKIGIGGKIFDLDDPDDAFQLDLQGALAVRESAVTSKRLRRGGAGRAMTGKPLARAPFGYVRRYDPTTKELIAQEIERVAYTIIREIVGRVLGGESPFKIANDFNRRALLTPHEHGLMITKKPLPEKKCRWSARQIERVLLSPTLNGKSVHKGEIVADGDWPKIIEDDERDTLTTLLKARSTGGPSEWNPVHLLSGLARCGVCNQKMVVTRSKKSPKAYACGTSYCVSRLLWRVDEFVEEVVIARLERDDAADLFVADDVDLGAALAEFKRLQGRLDEFTAAAANGDITAVRLGELERILTPQIEAARERSRAKRVPPEVHELIESDVPRERWKELDVAAKRRVIFALIAIRVDRMGAGGRADRSMHGAPGVAISWRHEEQHDPAADQLAAEAS